MEENFNAQVEEPEEDLGFFDKVIGMFTEPGNVFTYISKVGAGVSDWLLPLLLVSFLSSMNMVVTSTSPVLEQQFLEMQMAPMVEKYEDQVADGKMSQEVADQKIADTRQMMVQNKTITLILGTLGGFIVSFIVTLIFAALIFLGMKIGSQTNVTFVEGLSAYTLPLYISSFGMLITILIMVATEKLMFNLSPAEFMDINPTDFSGKMLSLLNPFNLWQLVVVGIGYAKLSKAESNLKYIVTVFVSFLVISLVFIGFSELVSSIFKGA